MNRHLLHTWFTVSATFCFISVAHAERLCSQMFALTTHFHNAEVKVLFTDGISQSTLLKAGQKFVERGTFDIPVLAGGYVAAANVGDHAGNYGRYFWLRDLARVQAGLRAYPELLRQLSLPQPEVLLAAEHNAQGILTNQMDILGNPQWTQMAVDNILDPGAHLDPVDGYRNVIWIRRNLVPFLEKRPPTAEEFETDSQWGHKQNDALAAFAQSFFETLAEQPASVRTTPESRSNILLLAAYFVRIQYWKMYDVGAWEETMALRTSSVAMVTSFLEEFAKGFNDTKGSPQNALDVFFNDLRENGLDAIEKNLTAEVADLVEESLRPLKLKEVLAKAEEFLRNRLALDSLTPVVETTMDDSSVARFEDSALLHILWNPATFLKISDQARLIEKLEPLRRPSGYIRYRDDAFLNLQNGEAQWTLPDAYLTQFFSRLYQQTGDASYLQKAKSSFLRLTGLVTGARELTTEGARVEAWRLPEAYVPLSRDTDPTYAVSPNSPLNWATAEFILAYRELLRAVQMDEVDL